MRGQPFPDFASRATGRSQSNFLRKRPRKFAMILQTKNRHRVGAKGESMGLSAVRPFLAFALMAAVLLSPAFAQQASPQKQPAVKDYYQRSLATYEFRKAAQSGPERGREIFYYKCWFCHNEFTKNAPQLAGLYQRGTLLSGLPVNDGTVKDRIRNGGAGMAAYSRPPCRRRRCGCDPSRCRR